jgi:hypothetical protein
VRQKNQKEDQTKKCETEKSERRPDKKCETEKSERRPDKKCETEK